MRFRPDLCVQELAIHGWDIRSRLEPEAQLSDESLSVIMDAIPGQFIDLSLVLAPGYPRHSLPCELTGAGVSNSDITAEGDKTGTEPAGTGQADETFRCDAETFILIALRRPTVDTAIGVDSLTIRGDNTLAFEFQRWFPGL